MSILFFEVGDRLQLNSDHTPHGVKGTIFTVVEKVDSQLARVDKCPCNDPDHQKRLTWGVGDHFTNIGKAITSEEAARAISLPTPEDAASFFGVKPNV